jgi:hypothetical protein
MLHPAVDMKHSEFQQNYEREIQRFGETGRRKDSTSLSRIGILGKDPKWKGEGRHWRTYVIGRRLYLRPGTVAPKHQKTWKLKWQLQQRKTSSQPHAE